MIFSSFILWFGFLLLLASICEGVLFYGTLYLALIGSVFIILIELIKEDKWMKYLFLNFNKFNDSTTLQLHFVMVIKTLLGNGNYFFLKSSK
jgi:hypothetical protein